MVTRQSDQDEGFEELYQEITAAEADLRSRFENTPRPAQATLMRIKARLLTDMRLGPSIQAKRAHWLRWGAAVAAAILVAAGAQLYYQYRAGPAAGTGPGTGERRQPSPDSSLETFASALPAALGDEDPALSQLNSDLKELETQTAKLWERIKEPAGPAAWRPGGPATVDSLAFVEHASAADAAVARLWRRALGTWRNG
jgi:hypothetical protein